MTKPKLDLIGSAEVAKRARVDRATLSRDVALGKITPVAQLPGKNGAMLFDVADVDEYAKTRKCRCA